MIQCSKCLEELPDESFTWTAGKGRPLLRRKRSKTCNPCLSAKQREWRKKNPGYNGSGKRKAIPEEERPWVSAAGLRLQQAIGRCRKMKRPLPAVSKDYLYQLLTAQDKKCAITGVTLRLEIDHPLCLSLDQIEPEKGYVEGNLQWVAWCVNRAKGDLSLNHFYSMCEAVLKYRKVQRLSP